MISPDFEGGAETGGGEGKMGSYFVVGAVLSPRGANFKVRQFRKAHPFRLSLLYPPHPPKNNREVICITEHFSRLL